MKTVGASYDSLPKNTGVNFESFIIILRIEYQQLKVKKTTFYKDVITDLI